MKLYDLITIQRLKMLENFLKLLKLTNFISKIVGNSPLKISILKIYARVYIHTQKRVIEF